MACRACDTVDKCQVDMTCHIQCMSTHKCQTVTLVLYVKCGTVEDNHKVWMYVREDL